MTTTNIYDEASAMVAAQEIKEGGIEEAENYLEGLYDAVQPYGNILIISSGCGWRVEIHDLDDVVVRHGEDGQTLKDAIRNLFLQLDEHPLSVSDESGIPLLNPIE